jgi:hypothetical protein
MASAVCETSSAPSQKNLAVWRFLCQQDTVPGAGRQENFCIDLSVSYCYQLNTEANLGGISGCT